jgi:hypothetical protein
MRQHVAQTPLEFAWKILIWQVLAWKNIDQDYKSRLDGAHENKGD